MRSIRTKANLWRLAILVCLCLAGGTLARASAVSANGLSGGITIAPATLTIGLAKNETQHSATFTVTNNYSVPVTLHFAVTKSTANNKSALDVSKLLTAAQSDLQIGAGQSATQIITLTDNASLAPGSQLATLIVSQQTPTSTGSQVGVAASVNVPIVTVKQAGAISSLGQGMLQTPNLAWTLPKTITTTVNNTGNVIAIPHGYITVQAPNGRLVASGAVNIASAAVSPGASLSLNAPVTNVYRALWPGMYRLTFSYGLGHGQPTQSTSVRILYLAWWHAVLLVGILVALYYVVRVTIRTLGQGGGDHSAVVVPAKKIRLVGRKTKKSESVT